MTSEYRSVVLAKRPKDNIIPGETFTLKSQPAPTEADLKDGEVLFESLYLSLDPAMRGWLNGNSFLPISHLLDQNESMRKAGLDLLIPQTRDPISRPSRSAR